MDDSPADCLHPTHLQLADVRIAQTHAVRLTLVSVLSCIKILYISMPVVGGRFGTKAERYTHLHPSAPACGQKFHSINPCM